jgi:Pyruvate/2-oxoacid:ferredoxin oxidoreductase gamma subunit
MKFDILIVGIGGQGVVLIADLLRQFLFKNHPDATITGTESRGVSQREGSVIASIRYNDEKSNIGPEIPKNGADLIIALEPIELIRNLDYANQNTIIILNRNQIIPKNAVITLKDITLKDNTIKNAEELPFYMDQMKLVTKVSDVLSNTFTPDENTKMNKNLDSNPPISLFKGSKTGKQTKKSSVKPLAIQTYSKYGNLIDVDLSSFCLKKLESVKLLNFLTLGFTFNVVNSPVSYGELREFLYTYFESDEKTKKKITPNLNAMEIGAEYAKSFL